MLTQNVRNFFANFKRPRADAEPLRKRNVKLAKEARDKEALTTVESARFKALKEESVNAKSKLGVCQVERATSRLSTHIVEVGASRAKEIVSNALMVASRVVFSATSRKFLSLSWKLMMP